ncbi:MAG: hypothetical protein IPO18_15180 [bacterium]|nr:hypothetical protein [bacterium]
MVRTLRALPWCGSAWGRLAWGRLAWAAAAVLAVLFELAAGASPARAAAPDPAAGETAATTDSLGTNELAPELEEVVGELDAADQPLPRRDLAAATAATATLDHGGNAWGAGRLTWRAAFPATGARQDGRLVLDGARLAGSAALRLRPGESAGVAGGGSVHWGRWRLWGGHLKLRHGFGLAAGDPARRGALAADQSFGGPAGGLAARTSVATGGAGAGFGFETAFGSWHLAALGGQPAPGRPGLDWAARLARAGRAGPWAVLVRRDSTATAVSASGRLSRQTLVMGWELAMVRPPAGPGAVAAVTAVAWQPSARWKAELLSGAGHGAGAGPTAVLPAGARHGWAVRLAWRDRGQGGLELLAQGAAQSVAGTSTRRRSLAVLEAAWDRRVAPGTLASLRVRRADRSDLTWDERAPWQPGVTGQPAVRTLLSAGLDWERGPAHLGACWRSFAVAGSTNDGNRQLFGITGRYARGGRWSAWADLATAWGDPVDLVRGLVPLPGVVAARHWGAWRSEALVGLGWGGGSLQLRAALARRLPAQPAVGMEAASGPLLEGWIEARASW